MAMEARWEPIAPGLFTWPADRPVLIGSRCPRCGEHYFPAQEGCPNCLAAENQEVLLGERGVLWSWTVQSFPPKPPYRADTPEAAFQPFGVGYVEMPAGLKVEARLTVADPARLRIGMAMRLTVVPQYTREDGSVAVCHAFAPDEAGHV